MFSALTRVTEFKCFVVTSLFPRNCLIREVPSSVSLMAIVFNCATSTYNRFVDPAGYSGGCTWQLIFPTHSSPSSTTYSSYF